jgi:hypothetical protein
MKYLCLAYGDEKDWLTLTPEQQAEFLAQDEALRKRGALMASVTTAVTTVRAWDGTPAISNVPANHLAQPLAGFSIIEAVNLEEAIRLVAGTPCARAKGSIEIRPIAAINNPQDAA